MSFWKIIDEEPEAPTSFQVRCYVSSLVLLVAGIILAIHYFFTDVKDKKTEAVPRISEPIVASTSNATNTTQVVRQASRRSGFVPDSSVSSTTSGRSSYDSSSDSDSASSGQ